MNRLETGSTLCLGIDIEIGWCFLDLGYGKYYSLVLISICLSFFI